MRPNGGFTVPRGAELSLECVAPEISKTRHRHRLPEERRLLRTKIHPSKAKLLPQRLLRVVQIETSLVDELIRSGIQLIGLPLRES